MNIVLLHTKDALEPPVDPVLGNIEDALKEEGHEVRRLVVDDSVEPLVSSLTKNKPDIVFNIAESFAGRRALESNVAALLNLLGLRYTGSSRAGLIMAGDKTLTKKVLSFHGIVTARFATVVRGAVDWAGDIKFPLILKPPQEDASLGITQKSIVNDVQELLQTMSSLQEEYRGPVLAEEFIEGREFYVGVLGNSDAAALPVMELDFSGYPEGMPKISSW
jgi:D-alanine-D-alanine ligase